MNANNYEHGAKQNVYIIIGSIDVYNEPVAIIITLPSPMYHQTHLNILVPRDIKLSQMWGYKAVLKP